MVQYSQKLKTNSNEAILDPSTRSVTVVIDKYFTSIISEE